MTKQGLPAVIVISSHVARGSVGNRAAVFALETLGFPVWAVPTVMLPWHPGHGPATRIVPDDAAFGRFIGNLAGARWIGEVGAVLSGYLGSPAQAEAVAGLVASVRRTNPSAVYLCDPVIGDTGGLYVPEATARAIRDLLIPIADIATPNRAELEWLTGLAANDMPGVAEAARRLGPATVLVTSAPATSPGSIGNALVTKDELLTSEHSMLDRPPNGLGDLLAAVFLARRLSGDALADALGSATSSVFDVLKRTSDRGADELTLEADAASLAKGETGLRVRSHPSSS